MKRPCEESSSGDSDLEETEIDVGSERVWTGHLQASLIRCASPTGSSQVMARKKRRGMIEKRRRDRINNSLSELRRLVPTALDKQGSGKLEKAEILQMTVDHLKLLQATGGRGFDSSSLALDFLSLGFHECVCEVGRYLSAVEGLDSSDPFRSRLLSHLTSCASSRDAALLAMTSSSSSCYPLHHHHHLPLPHPLLPPHWGGAGFRSTPISTSSSSSSSSSSPYVLTLPPDAAGGVGGGGVAPHRLVDLSQRSSCSSSSPPSSSSSSLLLPASFLPLSGSLPFAFPVLPPPPAAPPASCFTSSSNFSNTSSPPISSSSSSSSLTPLSRSKPYRPWGAEVRAF